MKHVLLYAYTAHNLGDDLFIDIICRRYPKVRFYLYAKKKYKESFAHLSNLHIISLPITLHRPFFMHKIDIVVYIGGSLFMQENNWRKELQRVKKMQIYQKPFFILGANFGPFSDKDFLQAYEEVFLRCTDICFRDTASYNLFEHIDQVRQADDIVFQYQAPFNQTHESQAKKYMVISVIYPSIRPSLVSLDDIYFEKVAMLARTFIEQGYQVHLLGFCQQEKDDSAIEEVMKILPKTYHPAIQTRTYETNIEAIVQLIMQADGIIASRFHAMILGFLYGKKVYPLAYSKKMTHVLDDLQANIPYTTLQTINSLEKEDILAFLQRKPVQMSMPIQEAKKQFLKLDQWLR